MVRIYCSFGKQGHLDFVRTHCTANPDFKVIQRNIMNCMGIFGIPVFVTVAVYIPIECIACNHAQVNYLPSRADNWE